MNDNFQPQLQTSLGAAFTIERELGGGGMSRVFVANDRELERSVVVKVLSPALAEGLSGERFMREIRVAASLQQANIVPVLWAGSTGNLPFYAMPFVEGESLRHRLSSGALPIAEVISIMRDVSRALAYAHGRGVVHRDIKPDNVLLSGGAAVVTDFGIAKAISASRNEPAGATLTQLGTSIGTPAYMSPEQAAGDPDVDHRADLYSLGCLAFELLTGRAVFADRSPQRMLAAHLTENAPAVVSFRPDCPPALASLVMRMLEKEASARPQSASDVLAALDVVTTSGPSASMPAALAKAPMRFSVLLAGYAALFALVMLLTKAAAVVVGLPDWVLPAAVTLMALGLPALLITAYVQRVSRAVALKTPTLTPGGTMSHAMPQGTMATMAYQVSPHVSWRRTIRGGYIALGGLVACIIAFMAMRAFGIGPGKTLFSAGTLATDDKLLISGFTFSSAADSALAPILAEGVRNALSQSRAVRLLTPNDVAGTLSQMKSSGDIAANESVAREVAERAGARAIVSGKIAQVSNAYIVSLALHGASNGDVLASFQQTANGPKELLEVVDALTRKLRGRIGESLRAINRSVPLEQATTSSLEALRLFSEGTQANDIDSDFEKAIRLLREAVTIDSTFALAWRKLSVALTNGGYSVASGDSAAAKAAQFASRLPERERGIIYGRYYESGAGFDRSKALAAYLSAYTADSNSEAAMNHLVSLYSSIGDYERALRFSRREISLQPVVATSSFLVSVLLAKGDANRAQVITDSLIRTSPDATDNVYVFDNRASLAFARGKLDSVRVVAEYMLRSRSNVIRTQGATILINSAILGGQLNRISSIMGQRAESDRGGSALRAVSDSLLLASNDIAFRNRIDDGVRRMDAAVLSPDFAQLSTVDRPDLQLATLYAQAGNPSKARAVLAKYESINAGLIRGIRFTDWHRTRGEIALAEKRYGDALSEFRAGDLEADGLPSFCPSCTQYALGKTFDAALQPDSAIASFERYLSIPSGKRIEVFYAQCTDCGIESQTRASLEKRLGELYDAKGDRTRAMLHYNTFLDLWKNADVELMPVVETVRKRVTALAAREGK